MLWNHVEATDLRQMAMKGSRGSFGGLEHFCPK